MTRDEIMHAVTSKADLRYHDLSKADLSGVDLSHANLNLVNLSGADLSHAHLTGATLFRANLTGANLTEAGLANTYLGRAQLAGACLWDANLLGANLDGAEGVVCAGTDPRGYRFVGVYQGKGVPFRIFAGCRWFTYKEAVGHWGQKGNQDALRRVKLITETFLAYDEAFTTAL